MSRKTAGYWFFIEPYVYLSIKKNWAVLYNSLTGKILEYRDQPLILKIIRRLNSIKNLMVISLSETDLENARLNSFVNDVTSHYMGDLIEKHFSLRKPVQMRPILKIQKDVRYLKHSRNRSLGENVLKYLTELTLFINSDCTQGCEICGRGFKQFRCCTVSPNGGSQSQELDLSEIKRLWDDISSSSASCLNILGGNIFRYSQLDQLLTFLRPLRKIKNFYLHYLNAAVNLKELKRLSADFNRLKLLVTFPVKKQALGAVLKEAEHINIPFSVIFIFASEEDFQKAEKVETSLSLKDIRLQPFYNGKNRKMFEENLFIDREELVAAKIPTYDIYSRETLNPLNFGRITVLYNGQIHANVNAKPLGNLKTDNIGDMLFKEMDAGTSWRRIRRNVSPCKRCAFQNLCPPLTDLNIAMKQNNLCHIYK